MKPLNLPQFEYKIKKEGGKTFLFDIIRKKYIFLTPEEWVRQHFIHYLISKNYPRTLMKIEGGHRYNLLSKRSDILVLDRDGKAFMLIECKATTEKINQATFDQAALYNLTIQAKYLAVTNGITHYFCQIDFNARTYSFLNEIPEFE